MSDEFTTPQGSSGATQSRPFPARAVKVMESAGLLSQCQTRVRRKPESESPGERRESGSDAAASVTAGETAPISTSDLPLPPTPTERGQGQGEGDL